MAHFHRQQNIPEEQEKGPRHVRLDSFLDQYREQEPEVSEEAEDLSEFESPESFLQDGYFPEETSTEEEAEEVAEENLSSEAEETDDLLEDMSEEVPEDFALEQEEGEEAAENAEAAKAAEDEEEPTFWEKHFPKLFGKSQKQKAVKLTTDPEAKNEMPAHQAAKYYLSLIPGIRSRAFIATGVTILMLWISLACYYGGGLPGNLHKDIQLCTIVLLMGLLTVVLLGVDIFAAGATSLIGGRPGAESFIFLSVLASVAESVGILITNVTERGVPCSILPAMSITMALYGAQMNCAGFCRSFMALHRMEQPFVVTGEEVPERAEEGLFLIKSRRGHEGFVHRSEEPDLCETTAGSIFVPVVVIGFLICVLLSLISGDTGFVFHLYALLLGLFAGVNWLFAIPMLFYRTSVILDENGSAVAGWGGARDVGTSTKIIITDSDVFPQGSVEITGIRLLDKSRASEILADTGSMLIGADAGVASLFMELMNRAKVDVIPIDEFTVGEGGIRAVIESQEVRVGNASYMYLCGVKIPDKFKASTALYTAIDDELMGAFHFRYRSVESIRMALSKLRTNHRKPIFAVRDFNMDQFLMKKCFDVSPEGFEFPNVRDRYVISSRPYSSDSQVAAVMQQDGLPYFVETTETCASFYRYGYISMLLSVIIPAAGLCIMVFQALSHNYTALSAGRAALILVVEAVLPCIFAMLEKR